MNIILKNFQKKAIADLISYCRQAKKEIVLKSCTGSGKTIILTHFIDRYFKENAKTCFVWFTPGKGDLEEQSKEKMDLYIHNSQTKLLGEVLTSGFCENDVAFINWEMVTNKKNNAVQDSEHNNLLDRIKQARLDGIHFMLVVDEQHFNNTYKANEIINLFDADKIIRASATPLNYGNANLIEIDEEDVIAEGLIKKNICINENVQSGTVANEVNYLLQIALDKHAKLLSEYKKLGSKVNPLIVIQIPNKSNSLQADVERYLDSVGINYLNKKLAVWLSNQKENLEDIEHIDAQPIAIIIKQAVALGWDCPRAQILVKLRDNMSETFEIQTIGRIRRMPEAEHYDNIHLDNCYLYTFDEKYIEGTKNSTGTAGITKSVFLKPQFKDFSLTKEIKSQSTTQNDPVTILERIKNWYKTNFNLSSNLNANKVAFETRGYVFGEEIKRTFSQGSIKTLTKENIDALSHGEIRKQMDTHEYGRQFHHDIGEIADTAFIRYDNMVAIIRRLFDANVKATNKLLALSTRELYSFVINNADLLKQDIRKTIAEGVIQQRLNETTNETKFTLPQESKVFYDPSEFIEFSKNVYDGYAFSGDNKSAVEIEFELWCEDHADWFYKNGDKGVEYFSIAYNVADKQLLFYPDYILSIHNEIWIIETKGGVSAKGRNEDIDDWSAIKFQFLKNYIAKHDIKGGFVVFNKGTRRLLITTDMYKKYERGNNEYKSLNDIL